MKNGEQKTANGIILVDKPVGWTSHDVVAKVRGILRQQANSQQLLACGLKIRVGHTGTLDPAATGLLVLVIGSYTKRAGEFSKLDKVYEAELTLGANSTTGDAEGIIIKKSQITPTKSEIKKTIVHFIGEIKQTPHKYSAIKIDGQRAYSLARRGKEVKLEPRKVKVYRLEVLGYRYPKLKILAEVSSGTYIRSLAEDIGSKLETGAYLSALRRTSVGKYQVADAKHLDNITIDDIIKS